MPHRLSGPRALLSTLLIALTVLLTPGAALAAFVPGTEDVPLAPGLTAAVADSMVFDDPAGRIVQSTATGSGDAGTITRFYAETLPQLGWAPASGTRWTRQGEMLDITIDGQAGRLRVRFQLSPRDPS